MHSSIMRTARSSSCQAGGGSASVHAGIHCPQCGPGDAPGVSLENPPWVWAWRPPGQTPQLPPGCGPGDHSPTPGQTPQPSLWV